MGTTADRAFDTERDAAATQATHRDMVENPDHARDAFEYSHDVVAEALEWIANVDADDVPAALMAAIVEGWRASVDYDERVTQFVHDAGQ